MSKVKMLERELYELIAAGEVIDRPSSVIKELTENSIDSGATAITAEIKHGGISYMRITDNGSGIDAEDISTAFLRHATSKIRSAGDLNNIHTLGFRGEALASVAAVSKVDVLSKVKDELYGVHYVIEGTEEKLCEQAGCPDGTTVVIRDIFYNVPARLKFLKKDVSEGNDIARIIEKLALSRPDISVRLIRDNKQVMFTPGDNKLYSAIYSVMGRQFAASLIPLDYSLNGINVTGYTVKPLFGMKNRRMQNFFVNGRYIHSFVLMRSLEEAYKNCMMEGKFPACVLRLDIDPAAVDVNVHPQKTDVRFSDEKAVYEAVYFAVKNAVLSDSAPVEMNIPKPKPDYSLPRFGDNRVYEQTSLKGKDSTTAHISAADYAAGNFSAANKKSAFGNIAPKPKERDIPERMTAEQYRTMTARGSKTADMLPAPSVPIKAETKPMNISPAEDMPPQNVQSFSEAPSADEIRDDEHQTTEYIAESPDGSRTFNDKPEQPTPSPADSGYRYKIIDNDYLEKEEQELARQQQKDTFRADGFRLIGEAYKTYIVAETENDLVFIDKHAAHERINFERLKSGEVKTVCQMLMETPEVRLSYSQYDAVSKNTAVIKELGFDIELLGPPTIRVKGIPTILDGCDSSEAAAELAQNLDENKCDPMPEIFDNMLHSIACKASVRANDNNSPAELEAIVRRIFSDEKIRYCPHGRPVMFRLSKRELEKQFKRIE